MDNAKNILWQYGDPADFGYGYNQLRFPSFALMSDVNTVLIADTDNHRVIEVDFNKNVLWQYGKNGSSGYFLCRLEDFQVGESYAVTQIVLGIRPSF